MFKIENYKKRIADKKIKCYLKLFGTISIEGPKYCGKTCTGRHHFHNKKVYGNNTFYKSIVNTEI